MSPHDNWKTRDGNGERGIVTVRPRAEFISKQGLINFEGISGETAGARGLCLHLVIIPPGGAAKPHLHDGFETAIHLLEGEVETRYGDGLEQSVVNVAGDFIFIPPGVPHAPRNLSSSVPARALVARNDPREQESVVLYEVER